MRILITNDDGIGARGIAVLEQIASEVTDDVWIVAPENDNSGASHSLTLAEPLRMRELDTRRYAVKGTPTDCVIMGVRFLLKDKPPNLVLSGVNRGQNLADDVTYSGTVAGAIQGALLGIPSVAMSLVCGPVETEREVRHPPIWETPIEHGAELLRKLLDVGWPEGVVINVELSELRAGRGQGCCRDGAGPARPGALAHRGPHRHARPRLLLGRHRAPARRAAQRHRPLGRAREPDLGDAALPRLHRSEDAQQVRGSLHRWPRRLAARRSGTRMVRLFSSIAILTALADFGAT